MLDSSWILNQNTPLWKAQGENSHLKQKSDSVLSHPLLDRSKNTISSLHFSNLTASYFPVISKLPITGIFQVPDFPGKYESETKNFFTVSNFSSLIQWSTLLEYGLWILNKTISSWEWSHQNHKIDTYRCSTSTAGSENTQVPNFSPRPARGFLWICKDWVQSKITTEWIFRETIGIPWQFFDISWIFQRI